MISDQTLLPVRQTFISLVCTGKGNTDEVFYNERRTENNVFIHFLFHEQINTFRVKRVAAGLPATKGKADAKVSKGAVTLPATWGMLCSMACSATS